MLVGRESERALIAGVLAGARVGDGRALVLSGDPGIGKTSLLAEAAGLVADMRLLTAQGIEPEQYVPFAGLLQLLRPVLPLLDQLPAPRAQALSSALLLGPADGPAPGRFAVGAATLSLLSRAAEDRPLAVLVDDGHLLDEPSADALVFAARRLSSDAVAVIVTVRPGEPGSAPWAALPVRQRTGLDVDAAAELLSGSGQLRDDQLRRLHQETAGNPLGLLELRPHVDAIADIAPPAGGAPPEVSERLRRAYIGQVRGLGDDARAALLVAAADGSSAAAVHQACAALGLSGLGLAEAVDAGLVTVRRDRVEFRHPLVRSAVYWAAEPEARRSAHRALAGVVPKQETDRLAWHLAAGAVAPDEGMATLLDDVARQASARGAHAIAAAAHERAAALTAAPDHLAGSLTAAAQAAWLAGHTDRATELLGRALAAGPEPALRARALELRGMIQIRCGPLDAALDTLAAAAVEAEETDPDTALRLHADAVHACLYLASPRPAMRASAAIERLLGTATDPDARLLGTLASGMAMVLAGQGGPGMDRIRGAELPLLAARDSPADRFRLPLSVQGALWLRDTGTHRELWGDMVDRLRDQAALGTLPFLLMHVARDAATTDRWDDAESAYREAVALATETGQATDQAVSLAGLAHLDARRGRSAECRRSIEEADEPCRRNHIRLGSLWLAFARGDLAAGSGDTEAAAHHYEGLLAELAERGLADPDQSCAPELVEAYVHLGRTAEAEPLAAGFGRQAAAKGQPWARARAERAFAVVASGEMAEEHFQAALRLHAETLDRYERARTELAFGSWLRRERRRVAARPVLRSALAGFELLGAMPWADKAAQELAATGETVQRRGADAVDGLTPQQRQIAQLLAQGRTTRETAAALFLSPKTVEYHLRQVYLKLGISSRTALAERFGR